ncbi:hypothetical protein [Thiomicrospira microaerophila]|uniref:hypothetical protein n=1 Tax=Thiomicrospira microaerophila TaxID=406020 RepID=UPI0005C836B1|nr:hypothetical protein [Thiomicrospira microaerophila]
MSLYTSTSMALNQRDENLLWVGTEVFPALVAAVEQPPVHATIAVVYDKNAAHAQIIAEQLRKKVKQPIRVISQQAFLTADHYGFVFICHPALHNKRLLDHINNNNMLSFSPFMSALEKGVDTSILISHQVRPRLNLKQIEAKNIFLKPFFVQVSALYEP